MCKEKERILKRTMEINGPIYHFSCSRCKELLTVRQGETYYSTEETKMIVCLECKEKEEKKMCETMISEATSIVDDREAIYGSPKENFEYIACLWTAFLGVTISTESVGHMMILLKIARLVKTPGHHDSLVDIAGYAECLRQIGEEE